MCVVLCKGSLVILRGARCSTRPLREDSNTDLDEDVAHARSSADTHHEALLRSLNASIE